MPTEMSKGASVPNMCRRFDSRRCVSHITFLAPSNFSSQGTEKSHKTLRRLPSIFKRTRTGSPHMISARWQRFQNAVIVVFRLCIDRQYLVHQPGREHLYDLTEKCVRKRDGIDALHCRVPGKIRVNEEEHRHIHGLSRIQLLLFETEALDFAKVRSNLSRSHTVCSDTDDICGSLVGRCVERESRLSGQHSDFTLLWGELPG